MQYKIIFLLCFNLRISKLLKKSNTNEMWKNIDKISIKISHKSFNSQFHLNYQHLHINFFFIYSFIFIFWNIFIFQFPLKLISKNSKKKTTSVINIFVICPKSLILTYIPIHSKYRNDLWNFNKSYIYTKESEWQTKKGNEMKKKVCISIQQRLSVDTIFLWFHFFFCSSH